MRLILGLSALVLTLSLPAEAEAGRRSRLKPAPDAEDDEADRLPAGTAPAKAPAEGSLWDFIEDAEGFVPTGEAIEASEELDAERAAEEAFLDDDPTLGFYADPSRALGAPLADAKELVVDPDDPLFLKLFDPAEFDIPVEINADVVRWLEYFTGRGRKYYAKWMGRSTRVRPMMYERLDAAGAPRDLVYLSMIESGYSTHAYSRAAAVGLWQFIAPTGRTYDLRVDWWVDERRDPYMATDAAIRFLTDLEQKFGHWYLAWAGYNGGPGRVSRGIRNHGTSDFWTLVEKDAFYSETDNYVPKIIAAAIIGKHPERYGFTGIEFELPVDVEPVDVGPSISLDVLAKCAGVDQEELQFLNPHLLRWATPPTPETTRVYVPAGRKDTFLATLAKVPTEERLTFRRHKVAKGETLSAIAGRYGVSSKEVQDINRISNPNRIYVGMELVIPVNGMSSETLTALTSTVGSAPAPKSSAPKTTQVTHVVRKGETLSAVAGRYGVSTADLMRWNKISDANHVVVGQRLTLVQPSTSWTHYSVRSGDTLSSIAQRHGCTVNEVMSWNSLRASKIYVGQKLKLKKS